MYLIAIVEPSFATYPGHMVIGQELAEEEAKFFGFRFDPDDLPADYRDPQRWQEYFYAHRIPGYVRSESTFVTALRGDQARKFFQKRNACDAPIETMIPVQADWNKYADYSFSPDDFHSEANPCYNCVTWATTIGNKLVPGFLSPVRQGRIKLILEQIRAGADNTGENNG